MSVWAVTWAYRQRVKPSGAKFVLVTLAQFADGDGYCWPGQMRLSKLTGMGERTIREHLDALEGRRLIRSETRRRENGTYTTNGYWLLAPADALNPPSADFAGGADQDEYETASPGVSGSDLRQNPPTAKPAGQELSIEVVDTSPLSTTNPPTPQAPSLALVAQARPSDEAMVLFQTWHTNANRERTVFSAKRRRLAVQAIKTYGLNYCLQAAVGWKDSPFHRGENNRGTVYNDFELIFRDSQQIERFYGYAVGETLARPTRHGMTDWQAIGEQWTPPAIGGRE
jgi:hypothetical protein